MRCTSSSVRCADLALLLFLDETTLTLRPRNLTRPLPCSMTCSRPSRPPAVRRLLFLPLLGDVVRLADALASSPSLNIELHRSTNSLWPQVHHREPGQGRRQGEDLCRDRQELEGTVGGLSRRGSEGCLLTWMR